MSSGVDLTIRQFERNEVILSAEFEIDNPHQDQIVFSPKSEDVRGQNIIAVTVSDIGEGGIGFQCQLFIPRLARGILRILDPKVLSRRSDGSPVFRVLFEQAVRVRRTEMTSHLPSYFIGVSFENAQPDLYDRLHCFIDQIQQSMHDVVSERLHQVQEHDGEGTRDA